MNCNPNQYFLDHQCVNYANYNEKISSILGEDAFLDNGNTAWMLVASSMVMLMTPGVALFYGGLAGKKNSNNTILMSVICMAVITLSWILVGYSLSFGDWNEFLGNYQWFLLRNVGGAPSGAYGDKIPHILFATFQNMFAQITPALISGSVVGRMKFGSFVAFIILWSLLIYSPLAHWVWSFTLDDNWLPTSLGWLGKLPSVDFAGGTVIHISSGFSGLAAAFILGKRLHPRDDPIDVNMVVLGTALLWWGWFGFNAGSALSANAIAAYAFINTHIAACSGMITYLMLESVLKSYSTVVGAASGILAGLVAITPACGYVTPMASIFIGIAGSLISYLFIQLKKIHKLDDTLDSFAIHGMSGVVGALLTGVFATQTINSTVPNGLLYGNPMLLLNQLITVVLSAGFSFFGTLLLLQVLKMTVGIRIEEEAEVRGIDISFHGVSVVQEDEI